MEDLLNYKNKKLNFENKEIENLLKKYRTPFYLYSEKELIKNYKEYEDESKKNGLDSLICFALKSNSNRSLLKILKNLGAGADIVSGGELLRALEARIPASKIVFSGVGKMREEIDLAIKKNIYAFNVESIEELLLINQIAKKNKKRVNVSLRLNPKVIALTHKHISTGYKTHKFGILKEDILKAIKEKKLWEHTKLIGLSIHIGSQLTDLHATEKAIKNLCELTKMLPFKLEFLDVGGGLGVSYQFKNEAPTVATYMKLVATTIKENLDYKTKVIFEPGRRISATAGVFITKVLRNKSSEGHNFMIVDGGMNDFVRPSLYDSYHEIYPSLKKSKKILTDVVGPICETADYFAHKRLLPKLKEGDFIAIKDTGAYGFSMSSHYNLRIRPAEILLTKRGTVKKISKDEKREELA